MSSMPSKKIFDASDLIRFRRSLAYKRIHMILAQVVTKVQGFDVPTGVLDAELVTRPSTRPEPTKVVVTPAPPQDVKTQSAGDIMANTNSLIKGILHILSEFNTYIDNTPPKEGPRRFGNLAFRSWNGLVEENIKLLVLEHLNTSGEAVHYLQVAFGSSLRLDYGTGHELSFLAFLGGVPNLIDSASGPELLTVFAKYYDLAKRLILVYNLEPAGSHGVWGLDDHFHLIYILGAAQFNNKSGESKRVLKVPPPVSLILKLPTIKTYKLSNLYVNGIAFIQRIKLGQFYEHSPIIYDIHNTVTLWAKVLSGLLKMYEVEVLGKFPVTQHFWFGENLYPWKDLDTGVALPVYFKEEEEDKSTTVGSTLRDTVTGTGTNVSTGQFLDGAGVKTTRTNVSMTGAPWARSPNTARDRNP